MKKKNEYFYAGRNAGEAIYIDEWKSVDPSPIPKTTPMERLQRLHVHQWKLDFDNPFTTTKYESCSICGQKREEC